MGVIFGNYPFQQVDSQVSVMENAFYETFSRVAWSISLSWIIFACIHGYGGPINWFLSLSGWQPLARISYCIYIVHLLVQLVLMASTKVPRYFNDLIAVSFLKPSQNQDFIQFNSFFRLTCFLHILGPLWLSHCYGHLLLNRLCSLWRKFY